MTLQWDSMYPISDDAIGILMPKSDDVVGIFIRTSSTQVIIRDVNREQTGWPFLTKSIVDVFCVYKSCWLMTCAFGFGKSLF